MIVMVAMTALNGRIVVKVGSEKMLKIGLLVQLLAGIWLACVAVFQLGFWAMALGIPFMWECFRPSAVMQRQRF
ncbi:Bicyclomycin resistance protein-like protein [Actinobacillus equuli]|nr:Bicyclomycin resistance protein-like protein [Actinobacillus equuli]